MQWIAFFGIHKNHRKKLQFKILLDFKYFEMKETKRVENKVQLLYFVWERNKINWRNKIMCGIWTYWLLKEEDIACPKECLLFKDESSLNVHLISDKNFDFSETQFRSVPTPQSLQSYLNIEVEFCFTSTFACRRYAKQFAFYLVCYLVYINEWNSFAYPKARREYTYRTCYIN